MKHLLYVLLVAVFFGGIIVACSKSSNNGPRTCDVLFVNNQPVSSNTEVEYLAGVSASGGTITSISYLDSLGTKTVTNPILPWTVTVTLKTGMTPSIDVKGTANKGGSVNASFVIDGAQSGSSCSN